MSEEVYRSQWEQWLARPVDKTALLRLSRKIANSFMDSYLQDGAYEAEYVRLLCEMATHFEDGVLSQIPSSQIFEVIVEQLCDDFEERQQEAYDRVMAQVVDFCRKLKCYEQLDTQLDRFGVFGWEDLYCRAKAVQERNLHWDGDRMVGRIYILSRVTIGADVAITSVLVQRLARIFPDAEKILVGNEKLRQIFESNESVAVRVLEYGRRGGIGERLGSWQAVVEMLEKENAGASDGYILIDPDSRISQLGVLPLANMSNYLFFNSRKVDGGQDGSMAELVNQWVDHTFGRGDFCFPQVWPGADANAGAVGLMDKIRRAGRKRVTTVNFGVGGNTRKRLGGEFERALLGGLLSEPETFVVLDSGFGGKERLACSEIIREIQEDGYAATMVGFGQWGDIETRTRLCAVDCTIGQMSALISQSDDYIGYDSACQHIAAALEVPAVTVFAGTNNPRFIRRWSACGRGSTSIVHVNTLSDARGLDYQEIVERVLLRRGRNCARTAGAAQSSTEKTRVS
jgi:hypothetical protein